MNSIKVGTTVRVYRALVNDYGKIHYIDNSFQYVEGTVEEIIYKPDRATELIAKVYAGRVVIKILFMAEYVNFIDSTTIEVTAAVITTIE